MTLVKRNDIWFPEFGTFFDDLFSMNSSLPTKGKVPSVNITENEKAFDLELAVPGLRKDDFKVEVENNILTISTEKKEEKNEVEKNYTRKEFSYSAFERSFTLPQDVVDAEKINAKYENGILLVSIPKKENKTKPSKVIKIA